MWGNIAIIGLSFYLTKEENGKSGQNARRLVHVWVKLDVDDETKRFPEVQT